MSTEWKSRFILMITEPGYIKTNITFAPNVEDYTYLTANGISRNRREFLFNKLLGIPINGAKKLIYRYRIDGPTLLAYYPNGVLYFSLYADAINCDYDIDVLIKRNKRLPSEYKLESPSKFDIIEEAIGYLPAVSAYDKLGRLRYKGYVKKGYKYFSLVSEQYNQCLLPARIWYNRNGTIKREEYWEDEKLIYANSHHK